MREGKEKLIYSDKKNEEMSTKELKKRLNSHQWAVIEEARAQIKNGNFLTNSQANKEIDEWLNK